MVLLLPEYYLVKREILKYRKEQSEKVFQKEFKEFLMCMNNALQAGHSVENAFVDAETELKLICGENSVVYREIKEMNRQVRLSIPIEKAFYNFAKRHPQEEVQTFAEIFQFGKRLGGDYSRNLRRTAEKLERKLVLNQDIRIMTTEKRLELAVMSVMPIGILLYMRIGSAAFMAPLYGNSVGVLFMTCMLGLYIGMLLLGEKLIRIEV